MIVRGNWGADVRGYGDFGTAFCSELDTAIAALGTLLHEADNRGIQSVQVNLARSFYDLESSKWRGTAIAWGEACQNLVNTAQGHITAVERALKAQGVIVSTPKQDVANATGADSYLSAIRFVGFAIGAVAIAYFAGPVVKEGLLYWRGRKAKA